MSIKPPISGFNREHQADRRDMFPAALLSVAVHGALFVGRKKFPAATIRPA